jgi:hypothetical protein
VSAFIPFENFVDTEPTDPNARLRELVTILLRQWDAHRAANNLAERSLMARIRVELGK